MQLDDEFRARSVRANGTFYFHRSKNYGIVCFVFYCLFYVSSYLGKDGFILVMR